MAGRWRAAAVAAALWCASASAAAQPPAAWNPEPWLQDLTEIRAALDTKYANLEWLQSEREVDLDALFAAAERAVRNARTDAGAMMVFNRLMERIGDGHVALRWPRPADPPAAPATTKAPAPAPTAESLCRSIGYYDPASPGIAPGIAGYAPLADGGTLPAGTAVVRGTRVGFLRIAIFMPQGSLPLCTAAVAALKEPLDKPCGDECQNRIITHAYRALGQTMMDRLAALKAAGAETLVVDVTGNGGGSEWTEAAARMLSRRPLRSAPLAFLRGEHWTGIWQRAVDQLTAARDAASGEERRQLDRYIAEAQAARAEAARSCGARAGAPEAEDCPRLVRAGYATGLVGDAPAGSVPDKPWAFWVFNVAQHHYRDGAWDGPVVVLTDERTASAAEQFAAVLQDNKAAVIVGGRTAGAGCGHSWGGTPTKLTHSGATLSVPDCVRLRADGSNEVRGILPDVAIPWRAQDGRGLRARLLEAALPDAVERARVQYRAASR